MANNITTISNGSASSSSGTNFAAGGQEALSSLIQQLLVGGTPEQQQEMARRVQEIQAVQSNRADYTKGAAFADSEGAATQASRQALEKLIPSINNSASGAGGSASSMRALLLNDAANKAAESAAALKLKASVDYGNISSGLSGVLANLTQQNNPVTKALIDAIQLSKGQVQSSQGASDSTNRAAQNEYDGLYGYAGVDADPWASMYASSALPKVQQTALPSSQNISATVAAPASYVPPVITPWWGFQDNGLGGLVQQGNSNATAQQAAGNTFTNNGWQGTTF